MNNHSLKSFHSLKWISKKLKSSFLFILFFLSFSGKYDKINAQAIPEKSIEAYVMQQMHRTFTPGVAIAIIKDGKVILSKGYGLSNVELAVFTDTNSVFQLLSITKQFTATGILLLAQAGKLSLDNPVLTYLPDLPAIWKSITVRNLLNHTSGIVDYTDIRPFFEQIRQDATPEELLKQVYLQELLFTPGSQFHYSNSNYFILGLIIEKLSGKTYNEFVQENIFVPLSMKATRVNDLTDIIPYRVNGYHWLEENAEQQPKIISGFHGLKNTLQNAVYISPTREWAAGGIVSSLHDLILWELSLQNNQLLSRPFIQEMIQPGKLNDGTEIDYGMGNELFSIRNHHFAGHTGGGMAFNTTYLRLIDDHLSIIVLCNQTTGPSKQIALHLASLVIPSLDYSATSQIPAKESKKITELLKTILQQARSGKVDDSLFAPQAQETAKFISRAGPEFLNQQGKLLKIQLLDDQMEGEKRIYTYKVQFEKSTITWRLELIKKNKVLSLNPQEEY